jgi:hypothetical protein
VFVFELVGDTTPDAVVVAYAFRDHWMWFNGYSYQGRTFSFVIWKDYNCVAWITADNSAISGSGITSQTPVGDAIFLAYMAIPQVNPYSDIWSYGSQLLN